MLNKITAACELYPSDLVIEIGPGIGGLTQALCQRAGKVIAIEKDESLIPILRELLWEYNNLEIIHGDALEVNYNKIISESGFERAKIAANLPYYISTPIIMGILENKLPVSLIVVMVQKEVARRMGARPSTKDYGALSLAIGYYASAEIVANVPRNSFMPRPNVDSALVRLDILEKPPVLVSDQKLMFEIIKAAFSQRRKTLVNCLSHSLSLGLSKEEYSIVLKNAGLDTNIRGEDLSLEDFAKLSELLS